MHLPSTRKTVTLWMFVVASILPIAQAEDNTSTYYTNGASVNAGASLIIGDTGTNNTLVISNATKVIDTTGIIGNVSTANYNSALISDPNTIWTNTTFTVGNTGSFNQVTIANGARLVSGQNTGNAQSLIGFSGSSSNNTVLVTGTNTTWTILSSLRVGPGFGNTLTVANGALVNLTNGNANSLVIGDFAASGVSQGSNSVTVTGSNSVLYVAGSSSLSIWLGRGTPYNQLIITNGGAVIVNSGPSQIGVAAGGSNDTVIVTGSNSLWKIGGPLFLDYNGNQLRLENGGTVAVTNITFLADGTLRNSQIAITGGNLVVANSTSSAIVDVRKGTNLINNGTMTVDNLFVTNGVNSVFVFNGGLLATKSTMVSNGTAFLVGNGASPATLNLLGGTHTFFNGLTLTNNATLEGNGTVLGNTTILGTLSPGTNTPAFLQLNNNLILASNATYAVDITGINAGSQYDQVGVAGVVNLSNSILKLLLGFTPAVGDQFMIISNEAAPSSLVQGTFAGLTNNSFIDASANGYSGFFRINYFGGDGNDVVLITTIPEPSTLALLTAMCIMFGTRWRR